MRAKVIERASPGGVDFSTHGLATHSQTAVSQEQASRKGNQSAQLPGHLFPEAAELEGCSVLLPRVTLLCHFSIVLRLLPEERALLTPGRLSATSCGTEPTSSVGVPFLPLEQ